MSSTRLKFPKLKLKPSTSLSGKSSNNQNSQISRFFSKESIEDSSKNTQNDVSNGELRKRKLPNEPESIEDASPPKKTFSQPAIEKPNKMTRQKSTTNSKTISTFLHKSTNDSLSDFETPIKKPPTPSVEPTKIVNALRMKKGRKRQADIRKIIKKNLSEEQLFSNVLVQHSSIENLDPDQLQLAMALSKSIADNNVELSEQTNLPEKDYKIDKNKISSLSNSDKQTLVRRTLEKYGFNPNNKNNKEYDFHQFFGITKSKKQKWHSKHTKLTRRSDAQRTVELRRRVDYILNVNTQTQSKIFDELIRPHPIFSRFLSQYYMADKMLFSLNACDENTSMDQFYTNNLCEISDVPCGYLLRDWSKIPGREISPDRLIKKKDTIISKPRRSEKDVLSQADKSFEKAVIDLSNTIEENNEIDVQLNCEEKMEINSQKSKVVTDLSLPTKSLHSQIEVNRQSSPDLFSDEEGDRSISNVTNNPIIISESESTLSEKNSRKSSTSCEFLTANSFGYKSPINMMSNFFSSNPEIQVKSTENLNISSSSTHSNTEGIEVFERFTSGSEDVQIGTRCATDNDDKEIIEIFSSDSNSNSYENFKRYQYQMEATEPNKSTSSVDFDIIHTNDNVDEPTYKTIKSNSFSDNLNQTPIIFNSITTTDLLSQESIEISDDEINYSMNYGHSKPTHPFHLISPNSLSQEMIDDHPVKKISVEQNQEVFIEFNEFSNYLTNRSEIVELRNSPTANKESNNISFFISDLEDEFDYELRKDESVNKDTMLNDSIKDMFEKDFSFNFKSTKRSEITKLRRTKSNRELIRNRFSRNSKFSEFLDDTVIRPTTTNIVDKPDEFDRMVSNNEISFLTQSNRDISSEPTNVISINKQIEDNFEMNYQGRTFSIKTGNITPKPDYNNMDSPTRLVHLKKYGLKPLKKRHAVICLEHIYNRLHPFVEIDEHSTVSRGTFIKSSIGGRGSELIAASSSQMKQANETNELNLLFNTDCVNLASNEFQDFNYINEWFLPSTPRARKSWCLQPLHIAWFNLIKANSWLHELVLQYKPIDLMEIRRFFKEIGCLYDVNDIITFFDRQCITFRTDNQQQNGHQVRSRKKQKTLCPNR